MTSPASELPPLSPQVELLSAKGEQRQYRKGILLIQEGDYGDSLYVLLKGRVRVFTSDPNGRELVFGIYGRGEYLGELSLDGGPRSASVETLEPTLCSVISRHALREHIANQPDFAFELLNRVIARARRATISARTLALDDAYRRLSQCLDSLAVPAENGARLIPERVTHQELASRIGTSREMVSRLLKDLQKGGYLGKQEGLMVLNRSLPPRW